MRFGLSIQYKKTCVTHRALEIKRVKSNRRVRNNITRVFDTHIYSTWLFSVCSVIFNFSANPTPIRFEFRWHAPLHRGSVGRRLRTRRWHFHLLLIVRWRERIALERRQWYFHHDIDGGTGERPVLSTARPDRIVESADRWCHGTCRSVRVRASVCWVEPTGRRDDASSVNCQRNHCPGSDGDRRNHHRR